MDAPTRGWKSDEERGPVGAWFVRAIGERSIETVAKDMADRGHVHKPDYYRGIMSGSKKPGRALLAALRDYLGGGPEEPRADQSDLASAIRAQAAAIAEQNELLRKVIGLWVLGEEMRTPAVLAELRAFVAAHLPEESTPSRPPISNHPR